MTTDEFKVILKKSNMDDMTILDFTEQLLIFRECGMIYEDSELIQANKVCTSFAINELRQTFTK
jgi:hypothetical protein